MPGQVGPVLGILVTKVRPRQDIDLRMVTPCQSGFCAKIVKSFAHPSCTVPSAQATVDPRGGLSQQNKRVVVLDLARVSLSMLAGWGRLVEIGRLEVSKTALGTEPRWLVEWAKFSGLRLCFDPEAVRLVGGPYVALEPHGPCFGIVVASDWDEVESVLDEGFLKAMGIATPWSERQARLVAMGLPK